MKFLIGRSVCDQVYLFNKILNIFHNFITNKIVICSDKDPPFSIFAITESRIKKDSSSPVNLPLDNYSTKQTPAETSAGGTLFYINKRLSYQLRNDLKKLYRPRKIESNFIEIFRSKSTNVIVGCIYI